MSVCCKRGVVSPWVAWMSWGEGSRWGGAHKLGGLERGGGGVRTQVIAAPPTPARPGMHQQHRAAGLRDSIPVFWPATPSCVLRGGGGGGLRAWSPHSNGDELR